MLDRLKLRATFALVQRCIRTQDDDNRLYSEEMAKYRSACDLELLAGLDNDLLLDEPPGAEPMLLTWEEIDGVNS